jgi:hypothetical protein
MLGDITVDAFLIGDLERICPRRGFGRHRVGPDALHAEHLAEDAGQDLFDRAVAIAVPVFGCQTGAGVEFAVERRRQRGRHQVHAFSYRLSETSRGKGQQARNRRVVLQNHRPAPST